MSGIFGALGVNDTERGFIATVGQAVVYDAIQKYLADVNAEVNSAMSIFVERTTSDHKLRYKLPGGGRLQRVNTQARPGAVKANGGWDVALPLESFGAMIAGGRVDWAYMTPADVERHLATITQQNLATVRFEILKALLNNTQRTFVDPLWGSLSIEPLANGDSVVYPPALGSETEASDDHYLESNYAAANISDTNDPYATIIAELEEHFGAPTGGSNLCVFINNAQVAKTQALTKFDAVNDRFLQMGANANIPQGLPVNMPGRVLGRHTDGCWVVEWRFVPASYLVGVHLDAPKPLLMRVDPSDTGLSAGLQLVAEDEEHPITSSHYEHRFGLGCGNRLNGVVMELGVGGSYSIPTGYA